MNEGFISPSEATISASYEVDEQGRFGLAQSRVLTIQPYGDALPFPMRFALELEELGPIALTGRAPTIAFATVERGHSYIGLEERVQVGDLELDAVQALVERLCSSCSQANAAAFAQAVEAMGDILVPPRAAALRLALLECERVISHLLNCAAMMSALGLQEIESTFRDERERITHAAAEWTGARANPGLIRFGGLARNLDEQSCMEMTLAARHVERALRAHVSAVVNDRELAARLSSVGVISARDVVIGGLRGPVARAAGIATDLRATGDAGAYDDAGVTVIVQRGGSAFARLVVRLLEALESLRLMEQTLEDIPYGPVRSRGLLTARPGSGTGRAEGPRGEVFCWVRHGSSSVTGLHLSAGSYPTLGLLEGLLLGQRAEDLEVLLLSLDICISCAER